MTIECAKVNRKQHPSEAEKGFPREQQRRLVFYIIQCPKRKKKRKKKEKAQHPCSNFKGPKILCMRNGGKQIYYVNKEEKNKEIPSITIASPLVKTRRKNNGVLSGNDTDIKILLPAMASRTL